MDNNRMILIADGGSTKTDWALVKRNDPQPVKVFRTIGYNPYFTDSEAIYQSLQKELFKDLNPDSVSGVYFYGAGCMAPEKKEIVRIAMARAFPHTPELFVGHDLLAAARALLGRENGFAAILGTGANTCLYEEGECTLNIDSLGYLLGDEGSGSHIGKKLVRDYMRKLMDPVLQEKFRQMFEIKDNEQIFNTLYSVQFPNRYLAGFCRFAHEHHSLPYIRNKVRDSFSDFFKNLVSKYPQYQDYSFNCIGSVGFIFKDILEEVSCSYNMKLGKVIQSPLEDMVKYHMQYE